MTLSPFMSYQLTLVNATLLFFLFSPLPRQIVSLCRNPLGLSSPPFIPTLIRLVSRTIRHYTTLLGHVFSPLPPVALNHGPHVMIYWHSSLPFTFMLTPLPQFYFLMGVDISAPDFSLQIFNFYHHVPRRGHGLHHLLNLVIPPDFPCLIAGDFNSHSRV